ncbi:DUF664 domain-containing protein [Streptomyces lydicus]|uniref:DUF664 domain-containing protein n=1 Tax=Streptomyces lydicus TaxID=47763 RepID=UPI001FCB7311|nr:DUF664 domain-containing protein [Streptomyces lydicus]
MPQNRPRADTGPPDADTGVLGLIKHLTAAEHYWFGWAYEGAEIAPDLGTDLTDEDDPQELLAADCHAVAPVQRERRAVCRPRPVVRPAGRRDRGRPVDARGAGAHDRGDRPARGPRRHPPREQADGRVGR